MVILVVTVAVVVAWESRSPTLTRPLDGAPRSAASTRVSGAPWPPPGLAGPRPGGRGLLPDLRGAWDEGVRKADEHLREGSPYVRIHHPVADVASAIDMETGIPLRAQADVADDSARAFDEGYRARVVQYSAVRGLPRVSRKPWLQDILLADRYFARGGSAVPLPPGGRVSSPDGTVRVERADGQEVQVTVRAGEQCWTYPLLYLEKGRVVDLLWGPAGSRTVFLRYSDDPAIAYVVLATDMKWRLSMNVAVVWPSPQRPSSTGP